MTRNEDLRPLAADVAAQDKEYTDARDEMLRASAGVLGRVVDELGAAKAPLFQNVAGLGAAILVAERDHGKRFLWLSADPEFPWVDGGNGYERRRYTTALAVMYAGWRLDDIVDGLCCRMEEQLAGNKGRATENTKARVARLRAVLELIK